MSPSTRTLTVAVVGATGQQGNAVCRRLLSRGHRVRALARRPEAPVARQLASLGADLHVADLDRPDTLPPALAGIDAAFLMATPYEAGIAAEVAQATAFIDAAAQAGIPHLVYSSGASVDRDTGIPHFDSKARIEQRVRDSGVPWTIIAPAFFMENLLGPLWLPGLRDGRLALALPPQRMLQVVPMSAIAAFAVAAMEQPDRYRGLRIDLATDALPAAALAAGVAAASGRDITYVHQPLAEMQALGDDFATMFAWFDAVGYEVDFDALRRLSGEVIAPDFQAWAAAQDWPALGVTPT